MDQAGNAWAKSQNANQMNGAWWFLDSDGVERRKCLVCVIELAFFAVGGTSGCPDNCTEHGWTDVVCPSGKASADPNDVVTALRAYRDNVLVTTENGQFYVALYEQLSPAMARAVFRDMNLLFALDDAADEWTAAFAALAAGGGAGATVTPTMQASLTDILDKLAASGDATIIEAVQRERTRLMLDTIADLSMDQLQDRLETLGGGVPAQAETWGSLKAQYR